MEARQRLVCDRCGGDALWVRMVTVDLGDEHFESARFLCESHDLPDFTGYEL